MMHPVVKWHINCFKTVLFDHIMPAQAETHHIDAKGVDFDGTRPPPSRKRGMGMGMGMTTKLNLLKTLTLKQH
jgi:hypothetical protein